MTPSPCIHGLVHSKHRRSHSLGERLSRTLRHKVPFITFTHQRVKLELQDPEHTVCIQAALFENKKLFCYIPMVKNEKLKALDFVY